jgi:hypothetical protein
MESNAAVSKAVLACGAEVVAVNAFEDAENHGRGAGEFAFGREFVGGGDRSFGPDNSGIAPGLPWI